jgi:Uma2 family endonuclease
VAARIAYRLMAHVERIGAGRVYAAETGFRIASDPDTVRAPDVAFVSAARVSDPEPVGFFVGAPDLAVEVLSPDDRPGEVLAKVADWLNGGARMVWVIDPERRSARVFAADGSEELLAIDGVLHGSDVLPGFTCPLAAVF